jgi:hypothetical protein
VTDLTAVLLGKAAAAKRIVVVPGIAKKREISEGFE